MLAASIYKTTYQRVPQDETSRASHAHFDAQPQKASLNAYKDLSLASPSINSHLDTISPLKTLSSQQRQQLKTDMQRVIDTILDPEPKYEILRASNTFAPEIRQLLHDRGIYADRFSIPEQYEAQIILDANTHYEALRPERLKPLLEIRYPQALSVLNTSQFLSVTEAKDTWVQLARLFLLHPMSEHQVFAANEGVRIDWHGATLFDGEAKAHQTSLAKSIEIARQGIFSLQKLKATVNDQETRAAIDESIADLLMQEAQGCCAHQPVEHSGIVNRPWYTGGNYNVGGARLQEAGKLYARLIDQCKNKANILSLREKLANTFVLLACVHYERGTTGVLAPSVDSWSSQMEKKLRNPIMAPTARADIYESDRTQYGKVREYDPGFTEQCFREAGFQLKMIIDHHEQNTRLEPKEWLKLHSKYASALIKQSLQMPFTHERNDEIRPILDKELKAIQKYYLANKNVLTPQQQVRALTTISDLIYAEAKQRPRRDSSQCWPSKQARKALKQSKARAIANRAYRIMQKNGEAEAMPIEAHFLGRRSSLSPAFQKQFKKIPYAPTATAIYGFTDQWSPKMHLSVAKDPIHRAMMLT